MEKVDVSKILPLCKNVYTERLEFAKKSILKCEQYDIPLFYPHIVQYNNGDIHLVVPPIVEMRRQSIYLGDGMHRIYNLLELNIPTVYVLATYDCILPLPGKPQIWSNVRKQTNQLPGHMNFEDFLREGLTGYSQFCNSNIFWRFVEE